MSLMEELAQHDGVYTESQEELTEIKIGANQKGRYMIFRTPGNKYTTTDKRVFWRTIRFFLEGMDHNNANEVMGLQVGELNEQLQKGLTNSQKEFKFLSLGDKFINLVSLQHQQIPWSKTRTAIKDAMIEVFGDDPEEIQWAPNRTNFKMMDDLNEFVDGHISADLGSNSGLGRASILTIPTIRVTNNVFNPSPPCMNWSEAWSNVGNLGNIKIRRIGQEGAETDRYDLSTRTIHITSSDIQPSDFIDNIKSFSDGIHSMEEDIRYSIEEPLTYKEMEAILNMYQIVGKLPKYILPQLIQRVSGETVWGLTQALSWVRTHDTDKFRVRRGDPMSSDLAWNLEKIAAEVLSLTPTLRQIHEEHGQIELDMLITPPEEFRVPEDDMLQIEITEDTVVKLIAEP